MSIKLIAVFAVALAGLAFVPTPPANAAPPPGPTAVAVAPNGITYVGFVAGGSLTRIDASGATLAPITLDKAGPVEGLDVDSDGNIWVSYGFGASKLSPAGALITHFNYGPGVPDTCPSTDNDDPSQYGGIAVGPTYVYVSLRCGLGVNYYSLAGVQAGYIPTPNRTRGIDWMPQQTNGTGPSIFVSLPEAGQVRRFNANTGAAEFTLNIPQSGSNSPRPAGVQVDKFGQLVVTDVANNSGLLFDTNNVNGPNSYSFYRTIGHPSSPSSQLGYLDNPTAISWYPPDGPLSDLQGNLFIADTGNNRIQRWNSFGFSFWATSTAGGPSTPTAPINTAPPTISGTPAVGQTLTCSDGSWSGSPTSYIRGWNRNGSAISGATSNTYVVQAGDAGQNISCFVRAVNAAGTSGFATSANVTISSAPQGPANTSLPIITGTAEQGQTLTCSNGSWTGSPTFTRVWKRNGTNIGGATGTTYVVTAADVGQAITCTVTATNGAGSASATSDPVVPTAPAVCGPGDPGISINNGAAFTTSEAVTLKIRPIPGATQVKISNDGGFDGRSWQALSGTCSYPWTLQLSGSDRTAKVVYVRFMGGGVNTTITLSDNIVLDKTAPSAAARITRQGTSKNYIVKVTARDAGSGVSKLQFGKSRAKPSKPRRATERIVTRAPKKFTWVRSYDGAGNVGAWRRSTRG